MTKFNIGDIVSIREDKHLIMNLSAEENKGFIIKNINMDNLRGRKGIIAEIYTNTLDGHKYKINGIEYSIPEENLMRVLVE